MCALCGMLGGQGHWSESASAPQAFAARTAPHTGARERQARARLLNRVLHPYGLSLRDWAGGAYVLRGATGRSAIVANLGALWPEAETLGGRECDPLDPAYLARLDGDG